MSLVIIGFSVILVLIAALTLFGAVARGFARRRDDATPDPVIADSKDQFDVK